MAAEDLKSKKRKSAPDSAPKPKKQKKLDDTVAAPKKSTKALKAAVEPVDTLAANVKHSRKRAEDFFSDDEATARQDAVMEKKSKKKVKKVKEPAVEDAPGAEAPKEKAKKGKKGRQPDEVEVPVAGVEATVTEEVPSVTKSKKPMKGKKSKQQGEAPEEVPEAVAEADSSEGEEELDDQTAALLAGFDSERDESDLEKEDEDFDEKALEKVPQLSKEQQKALKKANKVGEPGVVYLGRIPHGFFEPQMKKYFSQFGTVTRLRLSRNKKTGASKHYAFIEFAHADVADIVSKTMNNYLMFGHILQCRVVPPAQVHPELFKGANQRFKVDPRNKKAGAAMKRGAERAVWEKRVDKENRKRVTALQALKDEFGYDFSAPAVKSVDSVTQKVSAVEDGVPQQLIEAPVTEVAESTPDQPAVTETVKVKKGRKGKGGKESKEFEPEANGAAEESLPTANVKDKKRKSDAVEAVEEPNAALADIVPSISKKTKNMKEPEDDAAATEKKRKAKSADKDGTKAKKAKKARKAKV